MLRLTALAILLSLPAVTASAKDVVFTLSNVTSMAVTEFHLSISGDDQWSENIIPGPIPPGGSATAAIPDSETCVFDVRTVFEDGTEVEDLGYNLCTDPNYRLDEQ